VTAKPALRDEEVRRILGLLEPLSADRSIVLVGGQAVVFWTRFLGERSSDVPASTSLVSKDIDFEGSARAVRRAAVLLTARVRIASIDDHTPDTGIVLFLDADGVEREIDFIDEPLGLRARDVRDTAVRLIVPSGEAGHEFPVWVMHPERCMESRIYNAQILGKTDALARRQLDASIVCAREWSRYLLNDDASPERVRTVLRINERVFRKCMRDIHFRAAHRALGIDPFRGTTGRSQCTARALPRHALSADATTAGRPARQQPRSTVFLKRGSEGFGRTDCYNSDKCLPTGLQPISSPPQRTSPRSRRSPTRFSSSDSSLPSRTSCGASAPRSPERRAGARGGWRGRAGVRALTATAPPSRSAARSRGEGAQSGTRAVAATGPQRSRRSS
jgi:hypothetical protein